MIAPGRDEVHLQSGLVRRLRQGKPWNGAQEIEHLAASSQRENPHRLNDVVNKMDSTALKIPVPAPQTEAEALASCLPGAGTIDSSGGRERSLTRPLSEGRK